MDVAAGGLVPPDCGTDGVQAVRASSSATVASPVFRVAARIFRGDSKKGALLSAPAKLRYWDLYRDKYSNLAKDAQGAFRNLFGDAFARAYEEQLERLSHV